MTLYQRIEAMKAALNRGGFHAVARGHIEDSLFISQALAALPEPMTEDELIDLVHEHDWRGSAPTVRDVIRALKSADVIYCREDK